MSSRLEPFFHRPGTMQSLVQLDQETVLAGLDISLVELGKIRASQINACAYCLHMHTADALAQRSASFCSTLSRSLLSVPIGKRLRFGGQKR